MDTPASPQHPPMSDAGISPAVILRREREQAAVRIIVAVAACLYLIGVTYPDPFAYGVAFWFSFVAYTVFAIALGVVIRHSDASSAARRYLGNVVDAFAITTAIIWAGKDGIPLFAFYLWITLGNGFRFGIPALTVSATLSVIGFGIAVLFNETWHANLGFLFAVLSLLIAVPLGAARFLYLYRFNQLEIEDARLHRIGARLRSQLEHVTAKMRFPSSRKRVASETATSNPRPDFLIRERGQAALRVVVCLALVAYLFVVSYSERQTGGIPFRLALITLYTILSAVLAVWVARTSVSLPWRRYLANAGDVTTISYLMIATGEYGIPLFVLYLWVTLGNGFHFGIPALLVSGALSLIGFTSIVVVSGAIWQAYPSLIAGVFLSLILLPLYTGHLLRMLNAALVDAKEASAGKSQLLARMSQDLRLPLNAVLESVALLRDGRSLSPKEQSLLNVIQDSTSASLRHLDNVLDFSKIETGQITLVRADFDLHESLNNAAALLRRATGQRSLRLMVRIAPDVPFLLVGDSHYLRAILLNLMSNAVKYADGGRVWLDVITNEESALSATLRFEIIDTSGGIAADALDGTFQFSAGENATLSQSDGFGIAIAKHLVERLGGSIGMESIKGRGVLFWFESPFEKQAVEVVHAPAADERVVILSQDIEVVTSFVQLLPRQLVHSTSIEEVVELLAHALRLGNPFHLVLVDERMALGIDGTHHCADLCEKAWSMNVPVVLIADQAPANERLREFGYSAVLPRAPRPNLVYAALHASPLRWTASDPKVATVAPWLWNGREQIRRPRILLADDIQTNLLVTSRMLEEAGYDVDAVNSGDEALKRLLAGGYRLAVLDMHMPGFDGPDVLRQYRTLRPRSPVPIIMLTANVSLAAQQTCAEAGADAYLAKPVTAIQLLGEVKRLLNMHKVEVVPFGARTTSTQSTEDDEILDVSVLAELDRLCHDPRELMLWINQYEREGRNLLEQVGAAGRSRNHQAYCDAVHALKSTAANVGARKLMATCQKAGTLDFAQFLSSRDNQIEALRQDFDESLATLRQIGSLQDGRESGS